jgi:uncharacterized protein
MTRRIEKRLNLPPMTGAGLVVAAGAVGVGACVQGSVGFGFALLAGPPLLAVDARLVPGPLVVLSLVLNLALVHRERRALDLRSVRWAIVGGLPGAALGAMAVAVLSPRALTVTFALLVLAAVAVAATGHHVAPTSRTLLAAGAVSGFMNTAASIGGPPMALVYQRSPGAELRATLAGFFLVGSCVSLVGLAAFGELAGREAVSGLMLVPALAAGLAFSRRAARRLDAGHTRVAVLAVSATSAGFLLLRAAL